ncbi:MAG: hypothetical protein HYR73_00610 [Candidatus Eisenbacteria bacterium]|nr:hypothetical protein [Candidatus Eisenbacteria bacterium]
MTRPVRPVALVVLTACALYPGLTSLWQGLHPIVTGMPFNLMGQEGVLMDVAANLHLPIWIPLGFKAGIGLAWLAGVPGLWAGDGRAYPLALAAAAGSLLLPGGPMVMGVIGLVCLLGFRENAEEVPA